MVMRSFQCDCREAYVISNSYGMGDPLASHFREVGRTAEGGGLPAVPLAGITRPQLFEMTSPPQYQADRAGRFFRLYGGLGIEEKISSPFARCSTEV